MEWENGGKKFEFNAVITNKLAEKFLGWMEIAKIFVVKLDTKDEDGKSNFTWFIDYDMERLLKYLKDQGQEFYASCVIEKFPTWKNESQAEVLQFFKSKGVDLKKTGLLK